MNNENAKRQNYIRGTQRFTKPSLTNGKANVQINSKTAIIELQKLAEKYIGITNPHGFLTDLRMALGIYNSKVVYMKILQMWHLRINHHNKTIKVN